MSADSPPSPPPGPESLPPNGGEGDFAAFMRQKRRHRQNDDAPAGTQDEQIAALSSLLANLMRNKAPSESPQAKEVYRFNKGKGAASSAQGRAIPPGDGEPGSPATPAAPAPAVPEAPAARERDYTRYGDDIEEQGGSQAQISESAPPAPSPASVTSFAPPQTAPVDPDTAQASKDPSFWRAQQKLPSTRSAPGWWYWVLTILVALGAFLTGTRMGGPAKSTVAASQNTAAALPAWSEASVERLDAILATDQAGDLENAKQMAQALRTEAGPLQGLDVYLNLLDARQRKVPDAQSRFLKMAVAGVYGPQLAAIESALAFTFARERRFSDASEALGKAVLAEPFAAGTFRIRGESLRREGHFPPAVTAFREALLRYPSGALDVLDAREYVRYKIRLAEIEGNLPVESRSPATEGGATADSAGYWFLSDAAAALQQGKGDLAAAALQKAKAVLPAPLFERLLGDYFFRAYLDVPEVAAFFPKDADAAKNALRLQPVYFIDP
jgi:hypothetical protein